MAKHILDECLDGILNIFRTCANKYEAHLKSYPFLHRLAAYPEATHEIFRRQMKKPGFINRFNCTPDISLVILDEPECFMFSSFFGPNQEKRTDISYSTMHDHGNYLLSTINVKGIGYKSLIFKKGYEIDHENMLAHIELEKYVLHKQGNIEFIDDHTCHTVFYPEDMTQTYALFSTHFPTSQTSKLKSHPFIQKNKNWIKKLMGTMRVSPSVVNVAQYREDYFYPENGKIHYLSGQILPKGADHWIQNFFYTSKEFAGFSDTAFLKEIYVDLKKENKENDKLQWIEKAIEQETIPREIHAYDTYVPKRNVPLSEYQKIYNIVEK